ncbi:PLP-dependent transferase [Basidiobolus meristosporus CBS 931.73]|uniref:cystathionine gamma-synthase n=1 Tax=Basidiobolus meristosporus CBS 931.73 TaxID=1314790 RepID=A0A1Y1YMN1_9FUNG|nr:PLP-dependent transferase [Basidiobolus meristosporus CBS 931.73]|eukprot:ORX99255.1 PLP-dependent transferase [Basidiobolus meristosporus CBS 931.73]
MTISSTPSYPQYQKQEVVTPIPAHTPHAVSVCLPTWADNIAYEEGEPRIHSAMKSGYPRFCIHYNIKKLMSYCESKFAVEQESSMIFSTRRVAKRCRGFINKFYEFSEGEATPRIAEFTILPPAKSSYKPVTLQVVLFPKNAFPFAKSFWQHAGDGISSRLAEHCLFLLKEKEREEQNSRELIPKATQGNRHYNRGGFSGRASKGENRAEVEQEEKEVETYFEERYGRNLDVQYANQAKIFLRRRIAGVLNTENDGSDATADGERGIQGISENDVFLYPTGMSAIFHSHDTLLQTLPPQKSVCFGFPYVDTLKILQKFGPGCHFYGNGEEKDLDELEQLLESGEKILALYCEFPGNPLLKTPNLKRIRQLADKYEFAVVVDETVGNFVNVRVLEWADIVVSSLTKIFSGDSNVMGGSLVLNPHGRYYEQLQATLKQDYEDLMWSEDAIFLERNSRTFKQRIHKVNHHTETLCDFLASHPKVVKIFYPKYNMRESYDSFKSPEGGYGGLFSIILESEEAAIQFFDHLECAKGPSLGTNFTLVCPYTILAHYTELDWASQYGISRFLVRVSVGLECPEHLLKVFKEALDQITV